MGDKTTYILVGLMCLSIGLAVGYGWGMNSMFDKGFEMGMKIIKLSNTTIVFNDKAIKEGLCMYQVRVATQLLNITK